MDALLLTPRELGALLRLGKNKTYQLLASGEIPVIRFGRALRVPRAAVEDWIRRRAGIGPMER
jgi:excisionase family DNA binding protein